MAAFVASLVGGPASRAQPSSSARDQVTAAALFLEARALLAQGDYANACSKLSASLDLFATVSTRLNVAKCHEHEGKLSAAWLDYKVALVLNRETKETVRWQELEKSARDGLAALEPRLPRLRIVISAPPLGLRVTRDGQELPAAALGDALPVDPGPHDVEATAPGFERVKQTVTLTEGLTAELSLALMPLPPPPVAFAPAPPAGPSPPRAPSEGSRVRKVGGLTLVGVGGAGLLVGTVAGALAITQYRSLSPNCPGDACFGRSSYQSPVDAYQTKALVSNFGFIAGVAAMGAGIVLLVTAPSPRTISTLRLMPSMGLGTITAGGRL